MPITKPHAELLNSELKSSLDENITNFRTILNSPQNIDIIFREYTCNDFRICVIFIEGMANENRIADFVLRACKETPSTQSIPPEARADLLQRHGLETAQCKQENRVQELITGIIAGMAVVIADGATQGLLLETRGFAHRPVNKTANESVVIGSQEGFIENLRTNITLVRRYVQTSELVTEMISVGTGIPTKVAIMYIKGVVNEKALNEVRKRLNGIQSVSVQGTGAIQQLIEDRPYTLLPQMLQTERPDRTASCLVDGQVAILAENSPYALLTPVTIFHLIHASDDNFMRWQYASFLRIIRIAGMLLSLLLPGLYVTLTLHHTYLVPLPLLISIAQTRATVPFSILIEVLIMEFSFFLINEAGTRIPTQIGSTLGIVGALILGQAAVSASIISPILVIITALTGLGNFVIPNYGFGIGVVIYRTIIVFSGALLGMYGLLLSIICISVHLCSIESFGIPFLAPIAPKRPHNPDILLRMPLMQQRKLIFFARRSSWLRDKEREHA